MTQQKREIKFRAWDKKRKTMWFQDGDWIFDSEYDDLCFPFNFKRNIVDGNSDSFDLMQFTGLLDKNGKLIYEGDIVKAIDVSSAVEWADEGYWMICRPGTADIDLLGNHISVCEVIGNIYENPELLKETTK